MRQNYAASVLFIVVESYNEEGRLVAGQRYVMKFLVTLELSSVAIHGFPSALLKENRLLS
jgi:hypothetical protein